MRPVRVPRDLDRPEEVVRDRIRTEDLAVTKESIVDRLRALIADPVLGHAPDRTRGVVVVADPGTGVTTARDNSDRTIIAVPIINRVSKVSITRIIVAAVTISRIVIGSTTINTTIVSAIDAVVVLIIVVADAVAAVTVAVGSSTVSRASATFGTDGTSEIVAPHLAIDTAIVAIPLIQ